ncbi:hypothetical protein GPECTOR_17g1002 [Gonium pectorale]|uniref:Cation/H+ exchanger transmembrane domain-containing protein n=1 Tax=Gonium pectorale TaxID=33097 RepID=A0A150GJX7_GONPE|nr:hypothetical protein GPECTOR_17g1002 [Gonium pectorale]|eukprot:KXZ50129.1 hypothetical protein GPECTOR_17g1002 [Gonium pectorale]
MVCTSTLLAVPLMLWGMGLSRYGWGWADVALFNAMVASTDAVAVTSVLRAGGAPELLGALLEGESLFNDASAAESDDSARHGRGAPHWATAVAGLATSAGARAADSSAPGLLPAQHRHGSPPPGPRPPAPSPWPPFPLPRWLADLLPEFAAVVSDFAWLVVGGLVVGLVCGFIMRWALRLLQWRRLKPHVEVSLSLAAGYLSFYIANAYLESSGVIAVVVFGLYGAATGTWGLSSQARRAGAFDRFWDVLSFCINGLVFFLLGASSVNYLIRLGEELGPEDGAPQSLLLDTLMMLPVVYVVLFAMRGLLIAAFCFAARALAARRARRDDALRISKPGARATHDAALAATPDWRGVVFATVGGLRGAVSLIMAQIVLAAIRSSEDHQGFDLGLGQRAAVALSADGLRPSRRRDKEVTAQMVVWTSGFVLMSLVVNAPLLTPLMSWLKLNITSPIKQQASDSK